MSDRREVTPIPKPVKREKAQGWGFRRTRLKPISDKRRAEFPERDRVRAAVFKRDEGKCRIAPFLPDIPCYGKMTFQHLLKEGQGGAYTEANGISACSFHNDWVEMYPDEADALGLVIHPDLRGEGMDESTVGPREPAE